VPVLTPEAAPKPADRLNPFFIINDQRYVMVTQFAGAVPKHELRAVAGSLIDHDMAILGAIDMLISGY
jgi:toxin CcdB